MGLSLNSLPDGAWPTPADERAVVLLETSSPVEGEVLERWVRARGADVETVVLPGPSGADVRSLREATAATDDPWLVPLRVVWLPAEHDGHRVVRLRDVLLSLDNPRRPRPSNQRRILRHDPQRAQVVVGEPARVSALRERWAEVSGGDADEGAFAGFVTRQATLALERSESRLVGAQYKVPRLVREDLSATEHFRSGVRRLAAELQRDEDEVQAEATSYLEEMVTGWTRLFVDLGVRFGRYNFRRSYEPEIDFDPEQVARLHDAAAQHPLVFLPSHKSNLDTLVMNVALHDNGLPRTHVFGGINMAFWPMGTIFRHAGTVFIRRDTRGNPVYTFTLREYIGYLVEKRFSLQFYVEGGRSRTGKLLPPKLGLLAYVAEAFRQGRADDVVIVPVSIAYDQLQEVREFSHEAKGGAKAGESIAWLVKSFREQRGRFGRIYVRFGEPLSLRQALAGVPDGDEERLALQKVGLEVSRRINEVTPITATALVTLGLLGAQGRALTLDQVRATVHDPLAFALRRDLPITRNVRDLESNEGVERALGELERHDVVVRYVGGTEPVYVIGRDQHLAAAFYRNTIIHFFLIGALAQAALARTSVVKTDDPVATFWEAVLAGRDLLKFEFFFEPRDDFRAAVDAELRFQDPEWEQHVAEGPDGINEVLRRVRPLTAHTVLRSFLEAYGVVAAALVGHDDAELDERRFLAECLALGRQLQLQQLISSPESLAKPLFSNALELAQSRGLVGAPIEARREFLEEIRAAIRDVDVIEFHVTPRILALIDAGDPT